MGLLGHCSPLEPGRPSFLDRESLYGAACFLRGCGLGLRGNVHLLEKHIRVVQPRAPPHRLASGEPSCRWPGFSARRALFNPQCILRPLSPVGGGLSGVQQRLPPPRGAEPPDRSQLSVRPSVRPAVRSLPRAAGERAKLAHLSSAGAASTFKSRSSFSFTFCLLPGRASLTWGRAPLPIGCARTGRGESGAPPFHRGWLPAGSGRHRRSARAGEPEPVLPARAAQT